MLVVDSNAFIKQVRIETIGQQFCTVPQVLTEIRDAKARQFMKSFPFEIDTRDPTPAALKAVAAFARKTGDYAFLSPVDLRVLALVYTLEAEAKGSVAHLRTQPLNAGTNVSDLQKKDEDDEEDEEFDEEEEDEEEKEGDTTKTPTDTDNTNDNNNDKENQPSTQNGQPSTSQEDTQAPAKVEEEEDKESAESDKKEEEEDDGWITPENIDRVRAKRGQKEDDVRDEEVDVGCFTTDFAMQSVLIQMGLKLLSVDGMVIKRIRQYVLKCHSCFKICKDMERKFCPTCGNSTLLRFSATTDDQGNAVYYQAQRLHNRGTIFSIPLAKGGRNSNDLVLSEDVYMHKTKYKKNPKDIDVFSQDYSFAQGKTGPADRIVVGHGSKNPNIAKRRIGKKNKPISTL